MGDIEQDFNAEMDAFLTDGANPDLAQETAKAGPPAEGAAPVSANPSEAKSWKAGGREFKSPDELAKAYDNVWRLHGKTQNEVGELKKYKSFFDYLDANPDLRSKLTDQVKEYQNARGKGATKSEARAEAGLPKEVAQRLERIEAFADELALKKEIDSVKEKFKLDKDSVRKVLELSHARGGIPLEQAYYEFAYSTNYGKAKEEAGVEAKKAAEATKVGQPPPAVNPGEAKRISLANDKSWRDSLGKAVEGYFPG